MTIYEGSRYEHADVVRLPAKDGSTRPTVVPNDRISSSVFSFSNYLVQEGDRIDLLADRFLGNAELWWMISDYNPQWSYFDRLPAGITLRIPNALATP